ncbi:MAG: 1-acyl-sn-glycerol-3-phosphate acyltransferase [Marinifilaceae bacterium]
MISDTEYNSIRPYHGEEIAEAVERLVNSEGFIETFGKMASIPKEQLQALLQGIKTRDEFQARFFGPFTERLIQNSTDGVTVENLDRIDPDKSYVFMSNHRDIILDSAILNYILRQNGLRYTRAAIGSNLLINEWVTDVVKLNSCFVIERDIAVRQMLESSALRSKYLRHVITETHNSVWIAQREGRTKNGDDRTQNSLLKMLRMSGDSNFALNFKELNIVPTAISYEWEPCDDLKTYELYMKSVSEYVKTPDDDMKSMLMGMISYKGRVNFHVEPITDEEIELIDKSYPSNGERVEALTQLIDKKIHSNFKLWPNNYIAFDLANSTNRFADKYTDEEKQKFISMMRSKLDKLEGNMSMLNSIYLDIYANPVKNRIKFEEEK